MSSLEEKLADIDREMLTLHQFCVSQGFSAEKIQEGAGPLLSIAKAYQRKRFLAATAKVGLVVLVFGMLFYCDPVNRFLWAGTRILSIKLLPYWDWTSLHRNDCILDNPFYIGPQLHQEDCELCEGLLTVPQIYNASHSIVAENYLKQDKPFVITDAMADWPASSKFNVHFLNQLFNTEESLRDFPACMFKSNIRLSTASPKVLLRLAASGDINNYYAHWENCYKAGAKSLRAFFRRPYFMPPMVEMSETNWLFVAHTFTGDTYKPADVAHPLIWIGQIKGQMKVSLTPQKPCTETCRTLYVTLHEGSILVVTDLMWLVDYIPQGTGEMIAIGGGGFFE